MNKINLHTHTKHSLDGKLDINNLINESFKNGIKYLSITDHNTCSSYSELKLERINTSGTLIYGMEADAIINNITYDILCYGFDIDKVNIWATTQYGTIESRQTKIYYKLVDICKKANIKLDNTELYNPKEEFAHTAIYRMINKITKNKEFLSKYEILNANDFYRLSTMNKNFPLFINMNFIWPSIEELSKIIHDNGGKIFLAHPYKYPKNIDEIINSCSKYIDGIEISNETENEDKVKYLYEYSKKHNLLISAGSDYHGTKKHVNLDVNNLTEEMNLEIEKWITTVPGKILIYKD